MTFQQKFLHYYQKYMLVVGTAGNTIYLFQAYKIFVMGSAADVSFIGFLISTLSTNSWCVFGWLTNNKVLFYANLFGSFASYICLFMILTH